MNVMILIENAYSYAGTENICNFMSTTLNENDENHVVVCSLEGEGETFYPFENIEIKSFNNKKNKAKELFKYIKKESFDFVFIVSMGRLSLWFFLYKMLYLCNNKNKGLEVISCEHVSITSFSFVKRFLKIIALRNYNRTVCLTDKDSDYLRKYGINSVVINNPADHHGVIKHSRTYNILCVGRISYQKGYDILLPIWADFVKRNSKYRLKIAGGGDDLEALKDQATLLGISERIDFLGKVDNINDYYKESDFLLMTSRYEGLPLALLEAKAWSLPVIAFDCPTGPKEIIVDGVDGFIIPMGDDNSYLNAMLTLSVDDELIFNMSKNTCHTSVKFSSINIKRQWNEIISRSEALGGN